MFNLPEINLFILFFFVCSELMFFCLSCRSNYLPRRVESMMIIWMTYISQKKKKRAQTGSEYNELDRNHQSLVIYLRFDRFVVSVLIYTQVSFVTIHLNIDSNSDYSILSIQFACKYHRLFLFLSFS